MYKFGDYILFCRVQKSLMAAWFTDETGYDLSVQFIYFSINIL